MAAMKTTTVAGWAAAGALAVLVALVATDRSPNVPLPQPAATAEVAAAATASAPAAPAAMPKAATTAGASGKLVAAKTAPAPTLPKVSAPGVTLRFVDKPESAPGFEVTSFSGQKLTPADWRGKVVILNFWATWCGPCRYEIPELVRLQKEFQGSLQVVGLSVDEAPAAQVKAFIDQFSVNYPVGIASDKVQNEFGGILALPTSFVLDRNGRVVQKHVGLVPEDYYTAEIAYLAGEQTGSKVETFRDVGQVFPANAKYATSLPGVDMSMLTPVQRKMALKEMNEAHCECGCGYTVAQCRLLDSACPVSQKLAQQMVAKVLHGAKAPAKPAATAGSSR